MIEFNHHYWECGDGCCSDYLTDIIVDGVEAGTHSFFSDYEGARILYDAIKAGRGEFTFKTTPELFKDDDGEACYEYVSYINEVRLGVLQEVGFVHDIFETLGVNYTEVVFDADYERFRKDGVLEIEPEFYTKYYEF